MSVAVEFWPIRTFLIGGLVLRGSTSGTEWGRQNPQDAVPKRSPLPAYPELMASRTADVVVDGEW